MRGPIDFIIVEFEGDKFDGSILNALAKSVDDGIIKVLDMALLRRDKEGNVSYTELSQVEDEVVLTFVEASGVAGDYLDQDDLDEVGAVLEDGVAAGVLVIEQLWAKDLKKAILDANGVLVAEGRIHPDAYRELENEDK